MSRRQRQVIRGKFTPFFVTFALPIATDSSYSLSSYVRIAPRDTIIYDIPMLSYGLVIRGSRTEAHSRGRGRGSIPRPGRNMHAQRIHPGLFLYVITFNRNIQRALRATHRRLSGFPSHLTSAYHPQAYRYATHRDLPADCSEWAYEMRYPLVTSGRSPSRPQPCGGGLYFCPGRPFTIGNLHKRLTEAKLNHTREREKNRRASKLFVCMRESEDANPVEEVEKKEEGEFLDEEERKEAAGGKEEACGVRGREGEEQEGDESRRKIEESGTRKAQRRSPMEAKVYDASPVGVTDATTEALFQVGFLASCASLSLYPFSPSSSCSSVVHLRNNTWYTLGPSPVSRLRYTLYPP